MLTKDVKFMNNKTYLQKIEYISSEKIIKLLLPNHPVIIQIGAGCGKDYINGLIYEYDVKIAILVEPHPDTFKYLEECYSTQNNIVLENVAISNQKEKRKLFNYKNDMGESNRELSSLLLRRSIQHSYESSMIVECISLCALLKKHNINNIDLLQVDTEGFDCEIIKQIPFCRLQPTIIRFEIFDRNDELNNEDMTGHIKNVGLKAVVNTVKMLRDNNYDIYQDKDNIIAVFKKEKNIFAINVNLGI